MGATVSAMLGLLRPKQWLKNALVFGPLVFANAFDQPAKVVKALLCFLAMCLVSSATYTFNDLVDAERDRHHPRKRLRPVASGRVSGQSAAVFGLFLLVAGVAVAAAVNRPTLYLALLYLAFQAAYNLRVKQVPIADAFLIASGFVLRAVIGAAAIAVSISGWLLFCTGALALMFAFAKRRAEYVAQGEFRANSRESLEGYTKPTLDALFLLSAISSLVCYGIYSIESRTAHEHPGLILTTVIVAYAVCRYVMLVLGRDQGEEPESLLLRDPQIIACLVLFLLASLYAMKSPRLPLIEPGAVPIRSDR
ncbi:MAG TPA: UbiA prenyltransferase family protein [Fimbriimonas sp.]